MGPGIYKPQNSYDKQSTVPTILRYSVPREARKVFTDAAIKRSIKIPEPGRYKIENIDKKLSKGVN